MKQNRMQRTGVETVAMATLDLQKEKRDGLRARRKPLFERYEKNPDDRRLGLEIKEIDDQIAECDQQIERNRKAREVTSRNRFSG
jgi:hypothetical protein